MPGRLRVIVELDGVLRRFGRVVPDAVALCAAVRRIQRSLEDLPRAARLAVSVVRFGDDLDDPGDVRALADLAPWCDLDSLGARVQRLRVAGQLASPCTPLDGQEEAGRALFLTASHLRFEQALAAGLDARRVGVGGDDLRNLPYEDVPRIVEESLRIPTARPMSQAARTGGLLAIPVAGPAAGRRQALDLLRADPTVDWIQIGSDLVLYTEDPDLEDRLAAEPGTRHLSYAVHRHALVLELDRPRSDDAAGEPVYRGQGMVLREGEGSEGRSDCRTWQQIRRGIVQTPNAERTGPRSDPGRATRYLGALRRARSLLSFGTDSPARLDSEAGCERIRSTAVQLFGTASLADRVGSHREPGWVVWTSPYGDEDRSELVALMHRASQTADLPERGALALALAETLRGAPHGVPAILHCLPPDDAADIDEVLTACLLPDERNRLRIVTAPGLQQPDPPLAEQLDELMKLLS